MNAITQKILLFLTSLFFSLFLLEMILRLVYVPHFSVPPWQTSQRFILDSQLIYRLKPNATYKWTTNEFTETSSVNLIGLRGTFKKDYENTYKIIMVGDSFTYGHGLTDEQTIPFLLESILNESSKSSTTVFNAGVPGYSPDQIFVSAKKYIPLVKPHLVFLNYIPQNIENMVVQTGIWYRPSIFTIHDDKLISLNPLLNRLSILLTVLSKVPTFIRKIYIFDVFVFALHNLNWLSGIPNSSKGAKYAWAEKKLLLEIEEIKNTCFLYKCRVVISWLPTKESVSEKINSDEVNFLHSFAQKATTHAIPILDMTNNKIFDQYQLKNNEISEHNLFFHKDWHPNATGAAIVAHLFFNYLNPSK